MPKGSSEKSDHEHSQEAGIRSPEFVLSYSNHVVEHLGVKLYQNKPTNALAELISNSWDADAEHVWVDLNLDSVHEEWWISVGDDGVGMDEAQIQSEYLVIGRKRREHADEKTPQKNRPLMGRKGIGKLAPFGISKVIELFTVKDGEVIWLTMDLKEMLEQEENPERQTKYKPDVEFVGSLDEFAGRVPLPDPVRMFADRLESQDGTRSGTLVTLRELTFTNKSWCTSLGPHLVNRLVAALAQPDFEVTIEDELIDITEQLPNHALRIPEDGSVETTKLPDGRKIGWWALIVDLDRYKQRFGEDWTQDQAGVSVYAHGKVAQERPFFFGLRGREIYSRYLYGVVIADWVDELEDDLISTDRGSLDWGHPQLKELREAGEGLVRDWLDQAREVLKSRNRKKVEEKIASKLERIPDRYHDRFSIEEVNEMAETILSLRPSAQIDKVIDITFSAVAHIPSWELLKDLVSKVQRGVMSDEIFEQLVFDLRFFENVNLVQAMARRLKAMLALEHLIKVGAREVSPGEGDETASVSSMHSLIGGNPWLLDLKWVAVADELPPQLSLQAIKKAEEQLAKSYGDDVHQFESWRQVGSKSMDFFLLHITDYENTVIVVEIKRADKVLNKRDHRQIEDYLDEVQQVSQEHSGADWDLQGILIGGKKGPQLRRHLNLTPYPHIETTTWEDLLRDAKRTHQEFLTALAMGLHEDPRLRTYLDDLGSLS